ncbi:Lipoprotein signal peptidase [Planctomycetes bacterium Pan216]|uniref:Lipoprotein signal peptidase n=1 Tax=Kolteria novifilia TaxID=2527975 RepID=A0A518BB69_9BACT|nr:Lipoprotein signal peptidase [Planctomycetes bacterium Pan216]
MQRRHCAITLFLATAVVCFSLDLISKYVVADWVAGSGGEVVIIPGWLSFITRLNPGGMWSFLHQLGATANTLLAIFSCIAALAILLWALLGLRAGDRLFALILGMVFGGALGNLYDRLVFHGVRDFIDAHYEEVYHFPTFNLADSFLVVGASCLVLGSMFHRTPAEQASSSIDEEGAPTEDNATSSA